MRQMKITMRCEICAWWDTKNTLIGRCKRNPPTTKNSQELGYWPPTDKSDWCGEFKLKKEEILDVQVSELLLSVRCRRAMEKLNCYTIKDIVKNTRWKFLGIRGFGESSLMEIVAKLDKYGLKLKDKE
jgi:DNA-directed RNA polymerase alpha subunit